MLREQTTPSPAPDAVTGALLGLAIGDALGRPANGLSHQNVRLYFKGIKEYRDDEYGEGTAGSGTTLTRHALALAHTRDPAPAADLPVRLAESVVWGLLDAAPADLPPTAALHAHAIAHLRTLPPGSFDVYSFWHGLLGDAPENLARRLARVTPDPDDVPLDLADACGGTDDAERAWLFAVAMFARNPFLVEGTLLSSINVGGQTATVGALVGSLLGALHGAQAFPNEWHEGLAARGDVLRAAEALSV